MDSKYDEKMLLAQKLVSKKMKEFSYLLTDENKKAFEQNLLAYVKFAYYYNSIDSKH